MPHHQHRHNAHNVEKRQAVSIKTVDSVVYVTASKTFDGPIAGYSTAIPSGMSRPTPNNPPPADTSTLVRPTPNNPSTSVMPQTLESHTPHSTSTPSSSSAASSSSSSQASSQSSNGPNMFQPTSSSSGSSGAESSAPTASIPANAGQTSSPGMSGGAKAGLAIGLLLVFGLIFGLLFFVYRRKKAQDGRQRLDDEKSAMQQQQQQPAPLIPRVSIRRPGREKAPRLSLRPITDLFPDGSNNNNANNEKQATNVVNGSLAPPAPAHMKAQTAQSPSSIQSTPNEAANPFGDHAAELVGASAGAIDRDAVPKPLNVSRPSTPTSGGSPPMNPSAPSSPAMGPGGPLNVHRVQLDFSPSMEDELELRAGQLVRMLHEYDDGWALCIRLDRSQQGVVPRSCISKLPVKPRPAGPPGSRGPPPPGMRPVRPGHASMNSNGSNGYSPDPSRNGRMRSQSNQVMGPANGPFGSGQYRSSPGPQRPRASTASSGRRDSPPGGSPLPQGSNMPNRKPVPGQAM